MVFKAEELTELIGEYAAVITHVTITGCIAHALQRELTDEEAQQCVDDIKNATEAFISAYKKKMAQRGKNIGKATTDSLRKKLNDQLMLDCWVLMQKVTEETKDQTRYNQYDRIGKN